MRDVNILQEDKRIWSLHQRATLLQIIALELHHADAAVPQHRASIAVLLDEFFCPPDPLPGSPRDAPLRVLQSRPSKGVLR
jgi:hypothetical protein